jgi:glycosyltransferase involved in cell wall biosynthesis
MISCGLSVFSELPYQIHRAIKSILNQIYKDFELIIILDNPNNKIALEILEEYTTKDNRIKLIVNKENKGTAYSRNEVIKIIKGEYYVNLDADDEALPDRFEVQVKFMEENPDVDMASAGLKMFLENEHNYAVEILPPNDIDTFIRRSCPGTGYIFRYSSIIKYGLYPEIYSRAEDYHLLINWYIQGAKISSINDIVQNCYLQVNYQKKSIKSIQHSIALKFNYRKELNFMFKDYLYFVYDFLVLILQTILPSILYFKLFIFRNKK